MKYTEAQRILIAAFDHTPETRADYLGIEAEKSGYSLLVFYNEINKAYEALEKYVNTKEQTQDVNLDENGVEFYHLNIIQLTDGRQIDCENITELLEPLRAFGNYVLVNMPRPWNNKDGPQPKGKKYPDKYYALLHLVKISLNKAPQIGNKSKKEIIALGKSEYQTGQGFYREIDNIDLLSMPSFVKSLPPKKRNGWKEIIKEISGNDADVISWLKKQPN